MLNDIQIYLDKLAERQDLTREDASRAVQIVMAGGATPAQMGALLMGLRVKGETAEEITGGAITMRAKAAQIHAPENAIDTCGTGGDAQKTKGGGTFNISTAVAIVAAACGVPVAKHGNRSVSSHSGSADVLRELGLNLEADIPTLEKALRECNLCFMMAPKFHAAMRHVAPVRQELGLRTLFNLLGPLSNPAGVKRQIAGVYSRKWLLPMAEALRSLGAEHAWVVHGGDGMDELTTTCHSYVAELKDGAIREFEVLPEDIGVRRAELKDLHGGLPQHNAHALTGLLHRAPGPYRDIVLLNAAAALIVAGKADDLPGGAALAAEAIDSGRAKETLARMLYICGGPGHVPDHG